METMPGCPITTNGTLFCSQIIGKKVGGIIWCGVGKIDIGTNGNKNISKKAHPGRQG